MNRLKTGLLISIMFLQIYGTVIFDSEYIDWEDDVAADFMYEVFELVRVTPALIRLKKAGSFWVVYGIGMGLTLAPIFLGAYMVYCTVNKKKHGEWMTHTLQFVITYFFWMFYNPILETFISSQLCGANSGLKADSSIECYSGVHILLLCLSNIMLICAVGISLLISLLYQKTQPESDDTMAHLDNPLQFEVMLYRTFIFILVSFENDYFAIFIIKYIVMLGASILFIYQYIKFLPYFDELISTFYGFCNFAHAWILAISCVTFIIFLRGHFIIILVGIPPTYLAVQNIRTRMIEVILLKPPDKTTSELEAILQSHAVYSLITSKISSDQEIRLTGLVNLHKKECTDSKCPLERTHDLYDPCLDKFVEDGDSENLHKNQVYLKHFTKMYFEIAISNFSGVSGIRIAYAFFLFHAFNNVHASLTELLVAKKCKPNIMQSFEIYKFEQMIGAHMASEQEKHRASYYNLTSVIDFEILFQELSEAIWHTSDSQSSFWMHLVQPRIIDFNALDKDNDNIYQYAKETDEIWDKLCAINDLYVGAIEKYAMYQRDVRNNEAKANELMDKLSTEKRTVNNFNKHNDILFDKKTAVIHISASKDSTGKILKVNSGAQKVFGFSTNELMQNSISKVLPNIVARKHNELMEQHFRSGRSRILNKERVLFGVHKEGYCFPTKLLVKQMSRLEDSFIQYVGMILPVSEDYEYIITDMHGNIDTISCNLSHKLSLNSRTVFKAVGINVQLIAPDLIYSYQEDSKKNKKKYKEIGGEELTLIIPYGFEQLLTEASKFGKHKKADKANSDATTRLGKYNNILNRKRAGKKSGEVTPPQLLSLDEYKNYVKKTKVKCEIQDFCFGLLKHDVSLKFRVLRISGIRKRHEAELSLPPFSAQEDEKKEEEQPASPKEEKDLLEKIEKDQKVESLEEEEVKQEMDSSDFDEENVITLKPKEDLLDMPAEPLETPREPLESSRQLLNSGGITERAGVNLAPTTPIREVTEENDKNSPEESKEKKIIGTERKVESPLKFGEDDRLTKKFSNSPSMIEDENREHTKRSKIIDFTQKRLFLLQENFEETKEEKIIKQHFLSSQMKEKRNKEHFLRGAQNSEEQPEEKNESEGNNETEEKDEPDKQEAELAEEAAEEEEVKEDDDDNEGSMGSTSTGATIRSFYSIRAAIDEKFLPKAIKNMNYMTIFMFVLLLGLAIGYFASELSLYSSINNNIKNIAYSEERKNSLIDINLRVKNLVLINTDNAEANEAESILNMESDAKQQLQKESQSNLTSSSLSLKIAQTELSLKTSHFSSEKSANINPSNVQLLFKPTTTEIPSYYYYTVWQAMLEVVVTSLKIANMTIDDISDNSSAIYFISKNSLNSILTALNLSTNELVKEIENSRKTNMTIFLILLLVASAAALISTLVLIPVINAAKKSKEKVLLLFFNLDEKEIKIYQKKCEIVKKNNKLRVENDLEGIEMDENLGEEEKTEEKKEEKKLAKSHAHEEGLYKTYKEIEITFSSLVVKLLIFVIIIEGYFIIVYFLSSVFLNHVSHLVSELQLLISREPTHSFLLLIQKEVLMYNNTTTIEYLPAETFILQYHRSMYSEEENLLERFSENKGYHSSNYNSLFQKIEFDNVCAAGLTDSRGSQINQTACESFNEGILRQGLYASVIKYWDYLSKINTDFFNSARDKIAIREFINENRLQSAERLQELYFKAALEVLVKTLEKDIDEFFSNEFLKSEIIFIVYFIYLIFVYFVVWRLFLNSITQELWKSKSILGVVPPERLMSVIDMRQFILENSGAAFFSKRSS